SAHAQTTTSIGKPHHDTVPRLLIIQGTEQRTVAMEPLPFTIGRRTGKDLTLFDPRISRDHARIELEAGDFYLWMKAVSTAPSSTEVRCFATGSHPTTGWCWARMPSRSSSILINHIPAAHVSS